MSKNNKYFLVSSIIVVLIAIAAYVFFYAGNDVTLPIKKQLEALREKNFKLAYSYNTEEFKKTTSLANFQKTISHYPELINNASIHFSGTTINKDNTALVKSTLTAKTGSVLAVDYILAKEQGWKIFTIQIKTPPSNTTVTTKATNPALPNLYEDKNNRYSIRYPANWSYTKPNKGAVVFRGDKDSLDYIYTVDIETIFGKKLGGEFSTIDEFIIDLKKQYTTHTKDIKFLEEGPITLTQTNGKNIPGKYIIFTYTYQNYTLKQWQIILMRTDDSIFYLWAFTAPQNLYDNHLEIAKMMLNSWAIY